MLGNGQFESRNYRRGATFKPPEFVAQTTGIPKGRHTIAAERLNDKILRESSGFTRGDFAEERMTGGRRRGGREQISRLLQQAKKRQTPAMLKISQDRLSDARAKDIAEFNRVKLYNFTNTGTLNLNAIKDKPYFAELEKIRAISMNGNYPEFFNYIPYSKIKNFTKFRFNWGADGRPVFVPMTLDLWLHYFGSPERRKFFRFKSGYECGDNWVKAHAKDKFKHDVNAAKRYNNRTPLHVRAWNPNDFVCKKKKKSLWVRIRKVVVGAALVVAAVYLGPAALAAVQNGASAMTGGLIPAAGGGAGAAGGAAGGAAAASGGSSAVAAATTSQKILSGAKTLVGYVNKARTVKALVNGKMPPVPIGIGGASFGQWAMIVAKEEIKKEAMDAAMTAGTKYIEKKMSKKAEAELKAEIAQMQAELLRITPKEILAMPPEPDPELAAPIIKMQQIEIKRKDDLEKFIVPGLIVGGALLFGG